MKLLLFIFSLLLLTTPLWSRVIYVNQGGGGDVMTIQKGLNVAVDGDTVLVASGVYYEGELTFSGKAIYLVSEGGPYSVTIDGSGTGSVRIFDIDDGEGPNTIVDGFTVIAEDWRCFGIYGTSPIIVNNIIEASEITGILVNGGGSPWIKNNILINHDGDAIYIYGYSSPTIEGNLIYGSGGKGIYSTRSSPTIVDNVIMANQLRGISIGGGYTNIERNIVIGNRYGIYSGTNVINNILLYNRYYALKNGYGASPVKKNNIIIGSEVGIETDVPWSITMENNVITGCEAGIVVETPGEPHLVRNNIIVNNDWGVYCYGGVDEIDLSYNDVWSNVSSDYYNCVPGEGSVSIDPEFVDPERNHFALSASSPLIDLGDPSIFGNDSTRSDMGAYGGPDALPFALTLIPRDTLVTKGEDFLYDVILSNTTGLTQEVQAWAELILSNRELYPGNPILGPYPINLEPYETLTLNRPISHSIPQNAPMGFYEYQLLLGTPPEDIITDNRFYFFILP